MMQNVMFFGSIFCTIVFLTQNKSAHVHVHF
jgi:hypothetical protein